MSENNDYEVYEVYCEYIDFDLLILEIPTEDVEDTLAYFAKDKGLIPKFLYDDYLIATCVSNINQVLHKISNDEEIFSKLDFKQLRNYILEAVLNKNTRLDYDQVVINKNHVLKMIDGETKDGERLLIDNKQWHQEVEETDIDNVEEELQAILADGNELKDIEELTFEIKERWWKRIGRYVKVKVFNKEDLPSLLNGRFFHSSVSFNTFVVTLCLEDFEELFQLLENMGIPARVSPPLLMKELYDLCSTCNPFLTHENAQMFTDKSEENDSGCKSCKSGKSLIAGSTTMDQFANKVDKKKKVFADVPEEDLLNLGNNMKVSLIGQDKAVDSVVEAIQRASVGLKDPIKPIGSFLFAGTTGVGKCVKQGTLIFSEEGIKPIESFYTGTERQERLELTISSSDGPRKTEYIYKEGVKVGREITTDIGNTLGGSLIHPVTTILEDGSIEFKRFCDLTTDDYVAIQYNQNYFCKKNKALDFAFTRKYNDNNTVEYNTPTTMSKDLAYYIGILVGDGGLSIENRVYFTSIDKQLTHKFYDLSYRLFGVDPKFINSSELTYYFNSSYIYSYLKDICDVPMCKSTSKYIPSSILESSKECITAFIQGLMDTDGYYESKSKRVGITLSTKKLIEQLQIVLLNYGIISRVRHRLVKYKDGFNDCWELIITSKFAKKYFTDIGFRLRRKQDKYNDIVRVSYNPNKDVIPNIHTIMYDIISRFKFDREFHKKYTPYKKGLRKPSRTKLARFLKDLTTYLGEDIKHDTTYRYLESFVNTDIFWTKVTSIVDKTLDLYDFTVPETHAFISNGFISHNTMATKVLADELIKDRDNLVVIDCSEYSADHEYSKLIGAPNGYTGFEQGGILTNAVLEHPFSVVVFDEFEKASKKIHQLLLQVLEEGRLTDNKGVKVSFKDTVIIMTSNIGVDNVKQISKTIGFGDVAEMTEDKKEKAIESALKKKFKPEFLNRLDEIVYFNELSGGDYERIIDIELYKLNDNLQNNKTKYKTLELDFDKKIRKYVYKKGITKEYGARPLKRAIEKYIATPLAIKLLKGNVTPDSIVKVSTLKGEASFKIKKQAKKVEEPPFYLEDKEVNTDA